MFALAALSGDSINGEVEWERVWTPSEGGEAPIVLINNQWLAVSHSPFVAPGVLTVRARCGHQYYGPITLILIPEQSEMALQPLAWTNGGRGGVDYTDLQNLIVSTEFNQMHLATVKGSWPENTVFEWAMGAGEVNLEFFADGPGLTVLTKAYNTQPCVFSATVTVTAPGFDPQTLGPITLTVYDSGC